MSRSTKAAGIGAGAGALVSGGILAALSQIKPETLTVLLSFAERFGFPAILALALLYLHDKGLTSLNASLAGIQRATEEVVHELRGVTHRISSLENEVSDSKGRIETLERSKCPHAGKKLTLQEGSS